MHSFTQTIRLFPPPPSLLFRLHFFFSSVYALLSHYTPIVCMYIFCLYTSHRHLFTFHFSTNVILSHSSTVVFISPTSTSRPCNKIMLTNLLFLAVSACLNTSDFHITAVTTLGSSTKQMLTVLKNHNIFRTLTHIITQHYRGG